MKPGLSALFLALVYSLLVNGNGNGEGSNGFRTGFRGNDNGNGNGGDGNVFRLGFRGNGNGFEGNGNGDGFEGNGNGNGFRGNGNGFEGNGNGDGFEGNGNGNGFSGNGNGFEGNGNGFEGNGNGFEGNGNGFEGNGNGNGENGYNMISYRNGRSRKGGVDVRNLLNDMGLRFGISNIKRIRNRIRVSIDMRMGDESNSIEDGDVGMDDDSYDRDEDGNGSERDDRNGGERESRERGDGDDRGGEGGDSIDSDESVEDRPMFNMCVPGQSMGGGLSRTPSIGCIKNGCCAMALQIGDLCPGPNVCCFSYNNCTNIPPPTTSPTPIPTTTLTSLSPTQITSSTIPITTVKPLTTTPATSQPAQCHSRKAKSLACKILEHHNAGRIVLNNFNPSQKSDNSDPLQNIKDACAGRQSARSSYSCKSCPRGSPGGFVCLKPRLLRYIESLVRLGRVTITSIAGGCHSCNSRHYRGMAVEMSRTGDFTSYMTRCRRLGGLAMDESSHIHCRFVK